MERLHGRLRGSDPLHGHSRSAVGGRPGNKKRFARIVVAAAIIDALEKLNLRFPRLGRRQARELEEGRQQLEKAIGGKTSKKD